MRKSERKLGKTLNRNLELGQEAEKKGGGKGTGVGTVKRTALGTGGASSDLPRNPDWRILRFLGFVVLNCSYSCNWCRVPAQPMSKCTRNSCKDLFRAQQKAVAELCRF